MSKIQASILASAAPVANIWSHLELTGKGEELIPTAEVLKVFKDTLALIGNASNYVSQQRRKQVTESLKTSRPNLSLFLSEICRGDLGDSGADKEKDFRESQYD